VKRLSGNPEDVPIHQLVTHEVLRGFPHDRWSGNNTPDRGDGRKERKPSLPIKLDERGRVDGLHPRANNRFIDMVRHDGHVASIVMTNATADVVIHAPGGTFANHQFGKAHFHGWFPIASCPVRLMKAGALLREKVVSAEVLDGHVCDKDRATWPCPHTIAEITARSTQHERAQAPVMQALEAAEHRAELAQSERLADVLGKTLAPILDKLVERTEPKKR
jgi:hypothetical protein